MVSGIRRYLVTLVKFHEGWRLRIEFEIISKTVTTKSIIFIFCCAALTLAMLIESARVHELNGTDLNELEKVTVWFNAKEYTISDSVHLERFRQLLKFGVRYPISAEIVGGPCHVYIKDKKNYRFHAKGYINVDTKIMSLDILPGRFGILCFNPESVNISISDLDDLRFRASVTNSVLER